MPKVFSILIPDSSRRRRDSEARSAEREKKLRLSVLGALSNRAHMLFHPRYFVNWSQGRIFISANGVTFRRIEI